MTKIINTKIALTVLVITCLSSLPASAAPVDTSSNEHDSVYKYNALENKVSFFVTTNELTNTEEKLSESDMLTTTDNTIEEPKEIAQKETRSVESSEYPVQTSKASNEVEAFLLELFEWFVSSV